MPRFTLLMFLFCAMLIASGPPAQSQVPSSGSTASYGAASSDGGSLQQILQLQVGLDRAGCSPGCIDGRFGRQTTEALRAWRRQQGLGDSDAWDIAVSNRFGRATNYLANYVVTEQDLAGLAPLPATWRGKASVPNLGYETLREKLAESFHCSEFLLETLNPQVAWPTPPAGTVLTVPNAGSSRERLPQAARIEVNVGRKFIEAFDAQDKLIAHFPCSIAQKVEKRPRGDTKIVVMVSDPNYTFDPAVFTDDPDAATVGKRLLIPPGPNNPVGVAWIGLDLPGYGMHGTPQPEDVGHTESHGCFRLQNWNAARLLKIVSIGLPVQCVTE